MVELSLEHASFLAKHLSPHASVWRNLGTALNFRQEDLDNIHSCIPLIPESQQSFMQRLVEEWLEGKYPHTEPPTLAKLLKALSSRTVGLGTLATRIRYSLPQHDWSVDAKVFKIASLSDQGDIMFSQFGAIRVSESTNIYFKVNTSPEMQVCKWSSRGLVPIRDELYSGIDTPVLCIHNVDIDMDGGRFFCEIQGKYKHATIPVTLRVSCPQLDQFKESLASIYLAQPEVPQDSWPPVSNKIYINLALIKQQAINYGGEYARLTIRGDMDDILHHKEKIEYKNIFAGLRSRSLLLIEGRPGSGKTTFVHKITRDWAASKVQGPMRLVLLVSLRVLNSWKKPVTVEDILQLFNMQVNPAVFQERKGKGVCFIFDGLDEFSPLEGEKSVVYKIINKTYLPQSIVIVASRPAALVKLRQRANKLIEVIGFQKKKIIEYIKNYPFSSTSKADQLISYILSHPNVLHMCYLPIHAAMVAFLFEVMGKIPRTKTEIYKYFTHFTVMRSLSKHREQDELEDCMDTGKLESKLLGTICEIALEKTILKKQVLDHDEMKLRLQGKDCTDVSLGLVTVDRTAGLYGFKMIYTFLHLTYQEYLAAYHISTLSDEDQLTLIKKYGDIDHMQIVWKFYCGLVNFEGHEYKIKALVNAKNKLGLFDIQCAYESQQQVFCNFFVKQMDAQIILEDLFLTTSDFTALGYLIANSSMPISLSFSNCHINTEAIDALLEKTDKKPLCLCTLCFESCNIDLDSVTKLLSHQHILECLKISHSGATSSYTTLDDYGFSDIVSTSLANLKELSLTNVEVGPKTLSNVLQFCEELNSLTLEGSTRKNMDINATLLATKLSHYVTFQELHLSHKKPTVSEVITIILEGLRSCSNLQKLFLTNIYIKADGAHALATSLQYWPKLQELHLRECGIKEEDIADHIKYCPQLKVDISNIYDITDEEVDASGTDEVELQEFIKGVEEAIGKSGKIDRKLANIVFVGPTGSGKTSLMSHLLGRLKKILTSTGICEDLVTVDINIPNPSTLQAATMLGDTWKEMECEASFIRQIGLESISTLQETREATIAPKPVDHQVEIQPLPPAQTVGESTKYEATSEESPSLHESIPYQEAPSSSMGLITLNNT